jgi:hypothetical protein
MMMMMTRVMKRPYSNRLTISLLLLVRTTTVVAILADVLGDRQKLEVVDGVVGPITLDDVVDD